METPASRVGKPEQLLETAYRLFKGEGFHATGIDRILAEAKVAKMTLYRHFASKDELILAVLDWRAERFGRRLARIAETDATPWEKIDALFDWFEHWFAQPDFRGCLFQHALAEFADPGHPVHAAARRQKDDQKGHLRAMIGPDRSDEDAIALALLFEGATLMAEMGQGADAIRAARMAAALLLEARA